MGMGNGVAGLLCLTPHDFSLPSPLRSKPQTIEVPVGLAGFCEARKGGIITCG